MKRIFLIITLLLFISYQGLVAQYDLQTTNSWAVISSYNPAYAGQSGALEVTGLARKQWLGFTNAPETYLATAEMPINFLGRKHGVGVSMSLDKLGLFKHTIMSAQYAYKKKLWKGELSLGFQGGLINESFNGSKLQIKDSVNTDNGNSGEEDPALPNSDLTGRGVDFSIGGFYAKKNWYAGFSVSHLLEPQINLGDNNDIKVPRQYYLMGGYNIQLNNPLLELRSSALVKSSISMTAVDLSLRMYYNNMFYGGLGWRYGDAVMLMLGGKFKGVQGGYAYDFPTSKIRYGTTGSHEIFIKYVVDLSMGKGGKNKHKSVRIL